MTGFIAVDVETANEWPGSICQIALVEFDGASIRREAHFVNPEMPFGDWQRRVHGLGPNAVKDAPPFRVLWQQLQPRFAARPVVSYSAFDAQSLMSAAMHIGEPLPWSQWADACALAREAWPKLPKHSLDVVMQHLGMPLDHHNAEFDALACGLVFVKAKQKLGLSFEQAFRAYGVARPSPTPYRAKPEGATFADVLEAAKGDVADLSGKVIVFTGPMPFSRSDGEIWATERGAIVKKSVTRKTNIVVSGWATLADGGEKLRVAADMIADGQPITVLEPSMFLRLVGR